MVAKASSIKHTIIPSQIVTENFHVNSLLNFSSNLNGRFLKAGPFGKRTTGEVSGEPTLEGTGIEWYPWKRKQYSLIKSEMKIRPAIFP